MRRLKASRIQLVPVSAVAKPRTFYKVGRNMISTNFCHINIDKIMHSILHSSISKVDGDVKFAVEKHRFSVVALRLSRCET